MLIDKYKLAFDHYGNVYFIYDSKLYMLHITDKNLAELLPVNIQNFITVKPPKNYHFEKINQSSQKEYTDDSDDENEECIDYYPEDNTYKYHLKNIDTDNNSDSDSADSNDEQQNNIAFCCNDTDVFSNITWLDDDSKCEALYDTFVYDEHDALIVKCTNYQTLYRLSIRQNNTISFRPIGSNTTNYTITIKSDDIQLCTRV